MENPRGRAQRSAALARPCTPLNRGREGKAPNLPARAPPPKAVAFQVGWATVRVLRGARHPSPKGSEAHQRATNETREPPAAVGSTARHDPTRSTRPAPPGSPHPARNEVPAPARALRPPGLAPATSVLERASPDLQPFPVLGPRFGALRVRLSNPNPQLGLLFRPCVGVFLGGQSDGTAGKGLTLTLLGSISRIPKLWSPQHGLE